MSEQKPKEESENIHVATSTPNSDILNFTAYLFNQQYRETTIGTYTKILDYWVKQGLDINNIEAVKLFLAKEQNGDNTKVIKVAAYTRYLKWKGLTWEKPRVQPVDKEIWLPTITEVEALINAAGKHLKCFLQVIWETAARPNEANKLRWQDIDTVLRLIEIPASKHGKARKLPISEKCLNLLMKLLRDSDRVFPSSMSCKRTCLDMLKLRLIREGADELRTRKISFYTLRHFRATLWYIADNNLMKLSEKMGHKSIKHTTKYIHLAQVYSPESAQYITATAKTKEEIITLGEQGYIEYSTPLDGERFFRKLKPVEDIIRERELSLKSETSRKSLLVTT